MGNVIEIVVKVDDQASAQADAIAAKLRALESSRSSSSGDSVVAEHASNVAARVEVPVEAEAKGLHEEVKAEAEAASHGVKIEVPVEAKKQTFEEEFRASMAEADRASADASRAIRQSFSDVEGASRTVRAAFEDAGGAADEAGGKIDGAGDRAGSGGKKAADAGNSFGFLTSKAFLLTTAALALGPALLAIPAAMGALAVGGATVALGLGGVVGALKDYGQQSSAAGESSAQMAQTQFSNALAIRNAEQAIADAKRQAAIAAQNSADAVASAQEKLANAQQAEQIATENLNQAWKDATNTLADLNNSAADAANGVADAQLALQQAQENAEKVVSSSLSTDLQKQQALQAVKDAQQQLTDAQQRALEAQQSADDANAKGVAGSDQVVQAQRAQQAAAQNTADAQHALVVAQRNAADQQQQSAEQIAKAVQSLSDTYKQQELAAAAAASSGGGAANKFAQDMAKLTPAGQAFVTQLLAMKDGARQLAATAQTAMLPGLTQMLKDASPLMPVFTTAIRDMGTVVGNTGRAFGDLMKNPAFQGALGQVFKEGAGFAQQFGSGLVGLINGVTQAAGSAAPIVSGLGAGLHDLMVRGLPDLLSGLSQNATGVGQAFQGILTFVSNLGAPLGTISGALIGALAPAIQALASPAMQQALQSIANLIVAILQVAGPLITALAVGLVGALKAVNPLIQSLTKFLEDNHQWLAPMAGIILGIVAAWKLLQLVFKTDPMILAISALVLALVYCWEHFKGFRDFVHQMLTDLHNWFFDIWHWIDGVFHKIVDSTESGWKTIKSYIINPITDAYHTVTGWLGKILDFVSGLPGKLAGVGSHMWDWISRAFDDVMGSITGGFHALVNDLIDGVNWAIGWINVATHGISDIWTWIPGASGSGIPEIHTIPHWKAAGGPVLGGLAAIIGEAGIEAMRLPTGTTIMPHANTSSMYATSAAMGGGAQRLEIEWVGSSGGDELLTWLRKSIRVRHGSDPNSVQKALGQAF